MLRPVLAFVFGLFVSMPTLAQTPVGTIISVEGETDILPDQLVMVGDVIQTGPGGRALVLFLDETRITLGENAQLRVDEYFYDDLQPAGNGFLISIPQGAFLFVTGKMASSGAVMRLATPAGTIMPRSAATGWGGVIEQDFSIYADSGEFSFETNRGRIRVAQGEGAAIRSINAVPMRPAAWLPEKVAAAKNTIGLKNIDAARSALERAKAAHATYIPAHRDDIRAQRTQKVEELQTRPNQRRIDVGTLQSVKETVAPIESVVTPTAPEPAPVAVPPEPAVPEPAPAPPENLPSDPAMRQEALEKMALPPQPDPFGDAEAAEHKGRDPF
jgi:hypothetical protein